MFESNSVVVCCLASCSSFFLPHEVDYDAVEALKRKYVEDIERLELKHRVDTSQRVAAAKRSAPPVG